MIRLPQLRLRYLVPVVAIVGALIAGASGRPASASVAAPPALSGADLARLEAQVDGILRLLGDSLTPANAAAPSSLQARYDTLRRVTEALATRDSRTWAYIPSLAPVPGGRITSPYTGQRFHPILRRVQPHLGLDIAAPPGSPIRAAADGVVLATGDSPTYGLGVDVEHGNGFITRYAHASRLLVTPGTPVRRGQIIALVGSTGRSTGPHLHYEIFRDGWSLDPMRFMLDSTTIDLPQ